MQSEEELKVDITNRLMRRSCWGARYLPIESLVHWLSKRVKRNGKRVRRLIEVLVRGGYLLTHKCGKTVSLNPVLSKEITEYIERMIEKR